MHFILCGLFNIFCNAKAAQLSVGQPLTGFDRLISRLIDLLIPFPPLDNIRVMVIVWRLRGNITRTAPCWVVWHNVHSQQYTHVSSSYRCSRLVLSHFKWVSEVTFLWPVQHLMFITMFQCSPLVMLFHRYCNEDREMHIAACIREADGDMAWWSFQQNLPADNAIVDQKRNIYVWWCCSI